MVAIEHMNEDCTSKLETFCMKKLLMLCSMLFFGCSVSGMGNTVFKIGELERKTAPEIASWFATIKKNTLPKQNSSALKSLFESVIEKDVDWIEQFVAIEELKNLLLLQDSEKDTILHYLAKRAYQKKTSSNDYLLAVLKLLDFALPTLRPLKNTDNKTAYDLYMQRAPAQQNDTVKNILNPTQPTPAAEPISPEQLTVLAEALSILNNSIDSEDTESIFGGLFE